MHELFKDRKESVHNESFQRLHIKDLKWNLSFKNCLQGISRKMAQQLRAVAAFWETLGLSSWIYMEVHNPL